MSQVQNRAVAPDEADIRLDRWFRRHFPAVAHGRLQKLLRTGQVRVDGKRAQAGTRLAAGQTVRVPPLDEPAADAPRRGPTASRPVSDKDAAMLRGLVIHRDDQVIALNKPAGLAVQGGSGTTRHVDGMLDALRFDAAERPRLVHRLDRDTSGVLLLARSAAAAARLGAAFAGKSARKTYWAVTVGVPKPRQGRIDLPLGKQAGGPRERELVAVDAEDGKRAVTLYKTVDTAGTKLAWLALRPLTGRTHQLRAHAAALGTPILDDGKYGGATAHVEGVGQGRRLHLHARSIALPHPAGGILHVTAELPPHMCETFGFLGFDIRLGDDASTPETEWEME